MGFVLMQWLLDFIICRLLQKRLSNEYRDQVSTRIVFGKSKDTAKTGCRPTNQCTRIATPVLMVSIRQSGKLDWRLRACAAIA